ncbi:hypothetical protein EDB80DRAFT_680495 [Ilyonectria destructans]|nr:hypothetical protein EDB80DRAFT_680495 [Ilyonectria destructans]
MESVSLRLGSVLGGLGEPGLDLGWNAGQFDPLLCRRLDLIRKAKQDKIDRPRVCHDVADLPACKQGRGQYVLGPSEDAEGNQAARDRAAGKEEKRKRGGKEREGEKTKIRPSRGKRRRKRKGDRSPRTQLSGPKKTGEDGPGRESWTWDGQSPRPWGLSSHCVAERRYFCFRFILSPHAQIPPQASGFWGLIGHCLRRALHIPPSKASFLAPVSQAAFDPNLGRLRGASRREPEACISSLWVPWFLGSLAAVMKLKKARQPERPQGQPKKRPRHNPGGGKLANRNVLVDDGQTIWKLLIQGPSHVDGVCLGLARKDP